jgi:hypothetical protein
MIKKLCERTRGEVNEEEMGRMLDERGIATSQH